MPKKTTSTTKKTKKNEGPRPYRVTICSNCGMQWKHFDKDDPAPLCQGCTQIKERETSKD